MIPPGDRDDLARLYAAKADRECSMADALDPASAIRGRWGAPGAAVLVLKGGSTGVGDDEHRPLSRAEAEALGKALDALALPSDDLAAMGTRPDGVCAGDAALLRLAMTVEAHDPAWVIALDAEAGADAAAVIGVDRLVPGDPVLLGGRVWLAIDGFERGLSTPAQKRVIWAQLKTLATLRPDGTVGAQRRGTSGGA